MDFKITEVNNKKVAIALTEEIILTNVQSALDLIANANYLADSTRIVLPKSGVAEDFFVLSTGIAGEILQKFVNYNAKLGIYGDFSIYTSKPLKDFIYESNKGNQIFFTATELEAVERLAGC